jgi:hypothetical protein
MRCACSTVLERMGTQPPAYVTDAGTQDKRGTTLAWVSPQHSLHATHADAVALGQRTMRGASMSVSQQIADDLLAEAVDKAPPLALWRKCRTLLLVSSTLTPSASCATSTTTARTSGFEKRPLRSTRLTCEYAHPKVSRTHRVPTLSTSLSTSCVLKAVSGRRV